MPLSNLHKKKFKTNLAILAAILVFCLIVAMVTMIKIAKAQDMDGVIQCGEAVTGSISTESSADFCDVYQRQLNYKDSADQLREEITTRSENFAAPRRAAYEQYQRDLEQVHKNIE
ncbi:MAG: hypothetical protein KDJ35_07960 [Alphaproteobacteria bacterium]|nr:hypothetical protein [Alphaproteobacteria bacterium]